MVYVKKAISGLFRICVVVVSCSGCLSALKELYRELLMFDQVCAGREGEGRALPICQEQELKFPCARSGIVTQS